MLKKHCVGNGNVTDNYCWNYAQAKMYVSRTPSRGKNIKENILEASENWVLAQARLSAAKTSPLEGNSTHNIAYLVGCKVKMRLKKIHHDISM